MAEMIVRVQGDMSQVWALMKELRPFRESLNQSDSVHGCRLRALFEGTSHGAIQWEQVAVDGVVTLTAKPTADLLALVGEITDAGSASEGAT